jgi:hypothetical protein
MVEKERINLNICVQCEHEKTCFPILHFLHRITGKVCRQGRKRKECRQKQTELPIEKDKP